MFKYELKIAIRKLLKSKLYSSLNIVGLAVGLAACLIIATIVLNDLSYDRQWKNSKQLYKIIAVGSCKPCQGMGLKEGPAFYL